MPKTKLDLFIEFYLFSAVCMFCLTLSLRINEKMSAGVVAVGNDNVCEQGDFLLELEVAEIESEEIVSEDGLEDNWQKPANVGQLIYMKDNKIMSYDTTLMKEKQLFASEDLLDFDISKDATKLVYALGEKGFFQNSDIYLLDLETNQTKRLTENNQMASRNPKFYDGDQKVAYVRRTFDIDENKLQDGEIWSIDISGDKSTSRHLVGDESVSWFDLDAEQECIFCEADDMECYPGEMMKLVSVSNDGRFINYKEKEFGCFAGPFMNSYFYDALLDKKERGAIYIPSSDKKQYDVFHFQFPSDPYPFCIKNDFYDMTDGLLWSADGEVCQNDFFYEPYEFSVADNRIDMIYRGEGFAIYETSWTMDGLAKDIARGEPPLFAPDLDVYGYPDYIISDLKRIDQYLVFSQSVSGGSDEKGYDMREASINIFDTVTQEVVNKVEVGAEQPLLVIDL